MSWKHSLQTAGPQWSALMEYVEERIAMHTSICIDPERADRSIRESQAALIELRALQAVPQSLRAEAQIKAQNGNRQGY